ncbi:MAG: 4-phosphoerythronate dehydrogenase [Bacteroidales bacterium]|nr:4-phosphoerythronate dehydrogenase [Bacteroidales bacterium]
MKPLIVIDDAIPFIKGVFEPWANVHYLPAAAITNQEVKHATALVVRTRTHCNERLLFDSDVRFIATATIGFDHIDTQYCQQNQITWCNATGCNAGAVEQYVMSAIALYAQCRQLSCQTLTIGVVGVGHVGKRIATMAQRLGMSVLLNDPPRAMQETSFSSVSLQTIAEEADIITFHTPLTRTDAFPTYHMADEVFFSRLKRQPLIINAARGGIIDENALLEAEAFGKVSDFVIDCWENEPYINRVLLQKALASTPHIAGYSADGKANATMHCVRRLAEFLKIAALDSFTVDALKPIAPVKLNPITFTEQQLLLYPILLDSEILKRQPEMFEQLRVNYRLRREVAYCD